MARPKNTQPTVYKNIAIPKDLCDKIERLLFSEVEGKIPFEAQKTFFTELLVRFFAELEGPVSDEEIANLGLMNDQSAVEGEVV